MGNIGSAKASATDRRRECTQLPAWRTGECGEQLVMCLATSASLEFRLKRYAPPLVWIGLFLIVHGSARSDVRLPRIFSDGMVLQRGMDVPVWGWAAKGEKVVVQLGSYRAH